MRSTFFSYGSGESCHLASMAEEEAGHSLSESGSDSELQIATAAPAADNAPPRRQLAPLRPSEPTPTSEQAAVLTPAVQPKASTQLPRIDMLLKKRKPSDQSPTGSPPKKVTLTAAQHVEPKQSIVSDFHVPNFQHIRPTNGVIILPKPPSASSEGDQTHQFCTRCRAPRFSREQRYCGMCQAPML